MKSIMQTKLGIFCRSGVLPCCLMGAANVVSHFSDLSSWLDSQLLANALTHKDSYPPSSR